MDNSLMEILPTEWPRVRELFSSDWPKHFVAFYTVDNFIKWHEKCQIIPHLKFFCLNGDWKSDGTVLIIDRYQLFLCSLDDNNERLKIALSLLDWSKGFKVSSFISRHRPAVLHVVESKRLKKEYDSKTLTYFLARDEAERLVVKTPPGITLRSMVKQDAITADNIWPNKHQGSLFFLKRLIEWNPNVGAYDESGKLVAWCFRLQAGALGALQVADGYHRRGLGTLVTIAMAKKLAALDMDTYAFVGDTNYCSQGMFEKVGFKQIDLGYWLKTYPTIPFEWTD